MNENNGILCLCITLALILLLSAYLKGTLLVSNVLEGFHPLEAEILILVKDKELQNSYNISREVVEEAFPDIVWGNRS